MGDIVIGSWAQSDCIGVLYNMVVVMPELVESQIESSSTYVGFSRTQECPCTVVLWMGALISAYGYHSKLLRPLVPWNPIMRGREAGQTRTS